MRITVHVDYSGHRRQIELTVLPTETVRSIRLRVCTSMSVPPACTQLMLMSRRLLNDELTVAQTGINENSEIILKKHEYPLWTPINDPPTVYEGRLRCEKGPVKDLAQREVWPFTEYVQVHVARMELSPDHPVKPPIVTWLTQISHPNIIPNVPQAICLLVLGKGWKPDLRLPFVTNALSFLLFDPNPNSVLNHPSCLDAAKVCKKYGFPRFGKELEVEPPFG